MGITEDYLAHWTTLDLRCLRGVLAAEIAKCNPITNSSESLRVLNDKVSDELSTRPNAQTAKGR